MHLRRTGLAPGDVEPAMVLIGVRITQMRHIQRFYFPILLVSRHTLCFTDASMPKDGQTSLLRII